MLGLPTDSRSLVANFTARHISSAMDLEQAGVLRGGQDAIDWREHSLVIPWKDRFGRINSARSGDGSRTVSRSNSFPRVDAAGHGRRSASNFARRRARDITVVMPRS